MAKQEYGSTWWGKKWLDVFSNIDSSNRLPRGKTYANTGKVKDIVIKNGKISAKVQGSAPRPYKQEIGLKLFSDIEKKTIVNAVVNDPFILSKLLNREMPSELLELLNSAGIALFPSSWRNVNGDCSCPDYALPCKHLAAVIYMIANEIDRNPFLLFELRGMDLPGSLQALGLSGGNDSQIPIRKAKDLFKPLSSKETEGDYAYKPERAAWIDFSSIPQCKEQLLKLLSEKPLFCNGADFKQLLAEAYKKIARTAEKNALSPSLNDSYSLLPESDWFRVYTDGWLEYKGCALAAGGEEKEWDSGYVKDISNLDAALSRLPLGQLADYCPQIQALYWLRQTAAHLLVQGGIVPQLIDLGEERYKIRWLPATTVPQIKNLVDILAELLPPQTLIWDSNGKRLACANAQEQVLLLLSLFLGQWVLLSDAAQGETTAEALFFDKDILNPNKHFSLAQLPQAIQKWLQKFFLQDKDFVPLLRIDDSEDSGDFWLSCLVEDKREQLVAPVELKTVFAQPNKYRSIQNDILRDFTVLTDYLPEIGKIIQAKGLQFIRFDAQRFGAVFNDVLPIMGLLGVKVLLPKSLERVLRPRPSLRIATKGSVGANVSFVSMEKLLDFEWQIAIGDQFVSAAEFKEMMRKMRGLVKIKGEYVYLDEKDFANILAKLNKPPRLSENELLHVALAGSYEGAAVSLTNEMQKLMELFNKTPEIPLPKGIKANLRPYQQRGYEWLYKNAAMGLGSLLADDMGLGKTLQTITFLQKLKEDGVVAPDNKQVLAVLPTTLISNWQRELEKFAPNLSAAVYHGSKRQLNDNVDIILTSYGVARSDEKILSKRQWKVLLIDEAQNIKNTDTAQTKTIKKIKADVFLALSGTPVENRLSEYWSIFDFVNKGYLGSLKYFSDHFSRPIEIERNQESLNAFRKITAPFILRRLKTDKSIINDLPDKVEQDQICTLTLEQSTLYQTTLERAMTAIEKESDDFSRQGLVLQMITALKQICNHPSQFLKKDSHDADLSGKTMVLIELLERILEAGEKVLIFTQYREMGDLLERLIQAHFHFEPLWLHGGVSRKRRDEMVEQFQNRPFPKVFLLSLKAGGTGLNLTQANHVIHFDLWWNPAVEAQATDRAFRIGQHKNVQVYRFITQNTFEERINEMLHAKRELANLTVTQGENWVGNLSNAELKELFILRE